MKRSRTQNRETGLRLYLYREFVHDSGACRWAWCSPNGEVTESGAGIEQLPARAQDKHCRVVLESSLVSSFRLTLPHLPTRKLLPLLPAALEPLTLTPVDQLHLALIAPGEATSGQATVWAIDAHWLQQALQRLSEKGYTVLSVQPEIMLTPWDHASWAILQEASSQTLRVSESHFIHLGTHQAPPDASPPPPLLLEQLPPPQQITLLQNGSQEPACLDAWKSIANTALNDHWHWQQAPWPSTPDLLQGRFVPAGKHIDWAREGRRLGWGLATLALLHGFGSLLYWAKLEQEARDLTQEARVLAQSILPSGAQIVSPAQQVQTLWLRQRALSGQNNQDPFLATLSELGRTWPQEMEPYTLSWSDGSLQVTVHRRFASSLEAATLRNPALQSSKQTSADPELVTFQVRIQDAVR